MRGRRFLGIDLDADYLDLAARRFESHRRGA